jgi:hypothetical protein
MVLWDVLSTLLPSLALQKALRLDLCEAASVMVGSFEDWKSLSKRFTA